MSAPGGGRSAAEGGGSAVETLAATLESATDPPADTFRPVVVRLEDGELDELARFCRGRGIRLIDEYERQLAELAAARLPGGDRADRRGLVAELVSVPGGAASTGNWVFLPWEMKVVHLLDEDAYFEVVTDRNHDKITRQEQQRLRAATIGVMGLSIGGEAAATVAQEHLCGHIVLADYDLLDLSNLNRLSAGFDELGLPKTTIAARRVAKLNPYIEVTVFEAGVTAENAGAFLEGLDLLIEESDGLRTKFDIRLMARERGLDIIFAGDERGFLSVEPYGQAPDLLPFHGRIAGPQPPREEYATTRDFLIDLTEWLGGWDAISERSRQSLDRIGESLCGYPQLASEARFAAGQVGHVARRLLLGERVAPFLGHVDLSEIVPGAPVD